MDSGFSEKQSGRFASPCSSRFDYSPNVNINGNGFQHNDGYEVEQNGHIYSDNEQFQDTTESVSSTDDVPVVTEVQVSENAVIDEKDDVQRFSSGKIRRKYSYRFIVGLVFAVLALFTSLMLIDDCESQYLVPT